MILEPSPELSTDVNVGYSRRIVSEIRKGPAPPDRILDRTPGHAFSRQTGQSQKEQDWHVRKRGRVREEMFDFSQGHPL